MFEKINTIFAEKYRPTSLDNFIGNEIIINKFNEYIKNKDIPHILLYGKPGVGKTTLAKIFVNQTSLNHLYINASDENNIEIVRNKIKSFSYSSTLNNNIKIIILDEFDYMTVNAQAALRNLMETTSKYTRFILTANYINKIIDPIISRCVLYEISSPPKPKIAEQLYNILKEEKIKFNLNDLAIIIDAYYPDIRKILNETQKNINENKLIINKNKVIESDYKLKIIEILSNKKLNEEQKFVSIRKLIQDNNIIDFTDLYSLLYQNIDKIYPSNSEFDSKKANAILIIAEQQYQDNFVVDKEITFMATIVRLINNATI